MNLNDYLIDHRTTVRVKLDFPVTVLVYQLSFISLYGLLAVTCLYYGIKRYQDTLMKKTRVSTEPSMAYQVIISLAIGALTRMMTFLDLPPSMIIFSEVIRIVKDCCWVFAYSLLTIFVIEIQTYFAKIATVKMLKPFLHAVMGVYGVVRITSSVIAIVAPANKAMINASTLTHIGFFFILWCVGLSYGFCFLRRLGTSTGPALAMYTKFAFFLMANNIFSMTYFFVYMYRTQVTNSCKDYPCNEFTSTADLVSSHPHVTTLCLSESIKNIVPAPEIMLNDSECDDAKYFILKVVEKTIELLFMCMLGAAVILKSVGGTNEHDGRSSPAGGRHEAVGRDKPSKGGQATSTTPASKGGSASKPFLSHNPDDTVRSSVVDFQVKEFHVGANVITNNPIHGLQGDQ